MNEPIATEFYWLTLTALMTSLFWIPYILNRLKELKPWPALWSSEPDPAPVAKWANRAIHAHYNAVENLVVFAPLVIMIVVIDKSSDLTANACMIYFFSRLAHFVVYTFGVPLLRTLIYFVGLFCQYALALVLLGVL